PPQAQRARLRRLSSIRTEIDTYQRSVESQSQAVPARDVFYEKAHDLITSPAAKRAFDISQEPTRVRDQYGRTQFGQSCLLARRLIEAGVQFVTVTSGGWDTHQNNFTNLKNGLLPGMERGDRAQLNAL